jgi:hypothetical protein
MLDILLIIFAFYTLTCLLHIKGYGTYPAEATFGCSLLTL